MQMYGSLMTGHTNHKVIDEAANPIMKAYYTDRVGASASAHSLPLFLCAHQ